MARQSSIPEEIAQYAPCKCCRIRNDNGTYRVYKYSAVKLPSGKWSSNWGYLIGKIIPGKGFSANKRYKKELEQQENEEDSDSITDFAFGQYSLLMFLSKDILTRLEKYFSLDKAAQIYSYALILCANGFLHIDQINNFYEESYLYLFFKNYSFKMGYDALSSLLVELGKKGKPIKKFEQSLIDDSSKNIAIDGHVIRSCSTENDLAEPGYKMNMIKAPQVNLLIAYDTKQKVPLMYRTFRGSNVDKKSVIDFLESRSFTDTTFVADRGFFAPKVLELMSQNGNRYIIPVPSSDKNFKRIKKTLAYTSGEFVYKVDTKNSARVIYYEEQINKTTRIIVYKDMDENNSKRKSYRMLMAQGENNYTQENYEKYCDWWGVYFLQTNTDEPADIVYSDYKDRWSIETFNNYIKNDAAFQDLKLQGYYADHGFDFIMLITGLIHARLNDAVVKMKRPDISTIDVLFKAGHIRLTSESEGDWRIRNTRSKDFKFLNMLGYTLEYAYNEVDEYLGTSTPDSYVQKSH